MFLSVQKTASQCLILKAADLHENPTDWCDTPDHVLVFERVCVRVPVRVCACGDDRHVRWFLRLLKDARANSHSYPLFQPPCPRVLKAADLYGNPTDWCDTLRHVLVFERVRVCVCSLARLNASGVKRLPRHLSEAASPLTLAYSHYG